MDFHQPPRNDVKVLQFNTTRKKRRALVPWHSRQSREGNQGQSGSQCFLAPRVHPFDQSSGEALADHRQTLRDYCDFAITRDDCCSYSFLPSQMDADADTTLPRYGTLLS